jgi:hypothetical protein
MKLYIDDIREAPDESWTLVRTITEAIRFIARYGWEIKEISLDHDISFDVRIEGTYRPFPSPDTFAPVAYFIREKYKDDSTHFDAMMFNENMTNKRTVPKITIHTANPMGAEILEHIFAEAGMPVEINMMGEAHRPKNK